MILFFLITGAFESRMFETGYPTIIRYLFGQYTILHQQLSKISLLCSFSILYACIQPTCQNPPFLLLQCYYLRPGCLQDCGGGAAPGWAEAIKTERWGFSSNCGDSGGFGGVKLTFKQKQNICQKHLWYFCLQNVTAIIII